MSTTTGNNAPIDNADSSNGGLVFAENTEALGLSREDINKNLNLPNMDLVYSDIEMMKSKPKMPVQQRNRISRHIGVIKNPQNL